VTEPTPGAIDVVIVGDHPHSGRRGVIRCVDGKVHHINLLGKDMFKVEFENGDSAYAEKHHMRLQGRKTNAHR